MLMIKEEGERERKRCWEVEQGVIEERQGHGGSVSVERGLGQLIGVRGSRRSGTLGGGVKNG